MNSNVIGKELEYIWNIYTNTINDQFDRNSILNAYIYVAIPYQGFVRKARIFQCTFCGRQFIKKKNSLE